MAIFRALVRIRYLAWRRVRHNMLSIIEDRLILYQEDEQEHELGLMRKGLSNDERLIEIDFDWGISIKDRMSFIMSDQIMQRGKGTLADQNSFAIIHHFGSQMSNDLVISANTQGVMTNRSRETRSMVKNRPVQTFRSLSRITISPRRIPSALKYRSASSRLIEPQYHNSCWIGQPFRSSTREIGSVCIRNNGGVKRWLGWIFRLCCNDAARWMIERQTRG